MNSGKQMYVVKGIRPYDRCKNESVWKQEDNLSTYYNHTVETQCVVTTDGIEQTMSEILARKKAQALK